MELNKCKTCGVEIKDYPSRKRLYCSRRCSGKKMIGKRYSLGRKHTKEELKKMRLAMLGRHADSKNPAWKGNKVGYMGLHNWIRRKLGTPQYCRGKDCTRKSKKFHWANISGKYKRDIKDWIRLCVSCHSKLDWSRPDKKKLRAEKSREMLGNKRGLKKK